MPDVMEAQVRSWGKVICTVTVPLAGGGSQPVDRAELAAWLRRIGSPQAGQPRRGAAAVAITGIADAVESATGDEATVPVSMSAEAADSVRLDVASLTDRAINPPRGLTAAEFRSYRAAAYGLTIFGRAWTRCTGWQGSKQVAETDGTAALGSGYCR